MDKYTDNRNKMALNIYTTAQIRQLDADTIQIEGIDSSELMERAALGLFERIKILIAPNKSILALAGPGNNGGDALALSRLMLEAGFQLRCLLLSGNKTLSHDCALNAKKLIELFPSSFVFDATPEDLVKEAPTDYLIDGLFGSGLNKALEGNFARIVHWLNKQKALRISIDLPSGLYGENNRTNKPENIVRADLVLGVQFPRLAFLLPENEDYIGQWELTPLDFHPEALARQTTNYSLVEQNDIRAVLRNRKKFSHKGNYGHGLLIAGSAGMPGAAILAGRAALRAGLGLLSIRMPSALSACIQSAVPEAMTSIDPLSENNISSMENLDLDRFSAIAIGPGLGTGQGQTRVMKALLKETRKPLVIDADGLNILAAEPSLLSLLPRGSILTPHPGEFDRLAGASDCGYERLEKASAFTQKHGVYLILKGHYTCSIFPDGSRHFNNTGNSGMATAGSGDVLCGILLSLLAQAYSPAQCCLLGVYLHGLSGDLALKEQSEESLIAGDLIQYLGKAFKHSKGQI